MAKNIELLTNTMNWINLHPENHNQGVWGEYDREACETTMCFAGHAAILAGGSFDKEIFLAEDDWTVDSETGKHVETECIREYDENGDLVKDDLKPGTEHVANFAARRLGLTNEERSYLFSGYRTVDDLREFVSKIQDGYELKWMWDRNTGYYEHSYVKDES